MRATARPVLAGFQPGEISTLVNRRVVIEHASEAAFLWALRQKAVDAPHYALKHLARLDARLLAHLRGLEVAGGFGLGVARRELADNGPPALFVLAYLAASADDRVAIDHAVQLAESDPLFEDALVEALRWCAPEARARVLDGLSSRRSPPSRRISICARLALGPKGADDLKLAIEDPDAALRAISFRAIGELKLVHEQDTVVSALREKEPSCRFWAAWACALLGVNETAELAFASAHDSDPRIGSCALDIAMRCAPRPWAVARIRQLAGDPATAREAMRAAGAFGDPGTIGWLIEQMETDHARVAGEAFCEITGADLRFLDLDRDPPEEESSVADADEDLPYPDTEAVRSYWHKNAHRFQPGHRYLGGLPASADSAIRVLRDGFQRQRRGAAIELAATRPATPVFPIGLRADRQQELLRA
jgi:uncharacterized protein (TIGR02270 family)